MKNPTNAMLLAVIGLVTAGLAWSRAAEDPKLKPQELVALHLDSIGPLHALNWRKSCQAEGSGRLTVLAGLDAQKRLLEGRAAFLSEGIRYRSSMRFPVSDYPSEELAYDGKKTYVGQLNPGERSPIGQFLYQYESILKEGLIGGTLSTAWPLLDLQNRKPNLKYEGLKNQFDQELHELRYRLKKGGSGFQISLYFHPESYQHVATTYEIKISDPMAPSPEVSPRRGSTKYILEERFGDFRIVDGLTLPFRWKVRFITERRGAQVGLYSTADRDWNVWVPDRWHLTPLSIVEWEFLFDTVVLNVPVDSESFVLY